MIATAGHPVHLAFWAMVWGFGMVPAVLAQTGTLDRILAVVSGHVIMHSDVRAFIELGLVDVDPIGGTNAWKDALSQLVERRLTLDEVDRFVIAGPPPARIDRALEAVRARFAGAGAFTAALAQVGYTEDDLRQVLHDDARRDAYFEERFATASQLTEEELRAYHAEHAEDFTWDGERLPFDDVRDLVCHRLADEQRSKLIAEWVAMLSRRSQVIRFDQDW